VPGEGVRAILEEALAALPEAELAHRSRLLSRLAGTPPYSDSMKERSRLADHALLLARQDPDTGSLTDALQAKWWAMQGPDHVAERISVGRELLALADSSRPTDLDFLRGDVTFMAQRELYADLLVKGELEAADRELASLVGRARNLPPGYGWLVARLQAARAIMDGRFDEAERLVQKGLAAEFEELLGPRVLIHAQAVVLSAQRGRLESLVSGLQLLSESQWAMGSNLSIVQALVHHLLGNDDPAQSALDRIARHDFQDLPRDQHWLLGMGMLAELSAGLGDGKRSRQIYAMLVPYADLTFLDAFAPQDGSVEGQLGLLATAMGRWDAAEGHFEAALERDSRMGLRPSLLRVRLKFARMLLRRGRNGDKKRGLQLLAEAGALAAALGMEGNLAQIPLLQEIMARARSENP
jgi:hypothetical protein